MSLSRANFLVAFPEFTNVDTALLDAKLAEAELRIDAGVWGSRADLGQGYLTAHLLALSPFGNAARMVAKDGSTTYGTHWMTLIRAVTAGLRST